MKGKKQMKAIHAKKKRKKVYSHVWSNSLWDSKSKTKGLS